MEDFIKAISGMALAGLCAWVFLPRTFYYGDQIMLYSLETSFCNEYNVCTIQKFFPPLTLRVDKQKSEVVWLNSEDGNLGTWTGCTIADKENWACNFDTLRMVAGRLQSDDPKIQHPPGYVYRLYWLVSLLPDSKVQK